MQRTQTAPAHLGQRDAALWQEALAVLRLNDLGGWTKPAPRLYPHQWSWDSAFIAIGLAHVDPDRALKELESLFGAQWTDGRVPHIVFNPKGHDYFPGPERWATAEATVAAPKLPRTSGIVQPPVHAIAALRVVQAVGGQDLLPRMRQLYPKLLAWHRYLATNRDPEGSGLITVVHPWESGTDNSPRWDIPLQAVAVGDLAPYQRHDLKHVADASERPTQAEYDRYLWLVQLLIEAGYDDRRALPAHPFQVKDTLMTAIFALANDALAKVAALLGVPAGERDQILNWRDRACQGVLAAWDEETGLTLDRNVLTGQLIPVQTCAGLSPVVLPTAPRGTLDRTVSTLFGPSFAGAAGLAEPVVLSTAPGSPGFRPRTYWRGPSWPIVNWLFWYGLRRHGYTAEAANLRAANLRLLQREDARFGEYFDPFTAEPLGSLDQSWTAAVALDWLAPESPLQGRDSEPCAKG